MTTKAMTPNLTNMPRDPWASAPASWVPLPGTRADRAKAQHFQKPRLWEDVVRPEDRALVARLAAEVLATEPHVGHAFAARMLERLRTEGAAARTTAERERLHALDVILSNQLGRLPDLLARLRALQEVH
jgi:hypothetical protein